MDQTPPEKRGPDRSPIVHTDAYGSYTIDFRDFARDGMVLLGRAEAARDRVIAIAPDLMENLAFGDAAFQAFMEFVDAHISRARLKLPEDPEARRLSSAPANLAAPQSLDLRAEGIATVIWATGYGVDFAWIKLPVLDSQGMPIHQRGVTAERSRYFLGLNLLSKMSSSFIFGVGDDAVRLADHIVALGWTTTQARDARA